LALVLFASIAGQTLVIIHHSSVRKKAPIEKPTCDFAGKVCDEISAYVANENLEASTMVEAAKLWQMV